MIFCLTFVTALTIFTDVDAQDHCNGITNRYVCNPYVAGGFMICVNGMKHEFKCSGGLNFNSQTQTCDWPHKADCGRVTHAVNAPAAAKPPKSFEIEKAKRRPSVQLKRNDIQEDEPVGFNRLSDTKDKNGESADESAQLRNQDEEERHVPLVKTGNVKQRPSRVPFVNRPRTKSTLYPVRKTYSTPSIYKDNTDKKRIWRYKISNKISSPRKRYKQQMRKKYSETKKDEDSPSKSRYRMWNIRNNSEKKQNWKPKPTALKRKPIRTNARKRTPKITKNDKYKSVKLPQRAPSRKSKGVIRLPGTCHPDSCKPPNCQCALHEIPLGLSKKETPMMVMLTFDDGVNNINMPYYGKMFGGEITNPNGCPMKSTFFVSGDATNYDFVSTLHANGHEIASHSLSHRMPQTWWASAGYQGFKAEIEGMRERLARQSKIPLSDIKGMRAPFLQIGGDAQYQMLTDYEYQYDSSMLTGHPYKNNRAPVWPFTLDYPPKSTYCGLPPCPTKSYPGLWEVPLIRWYGSNNVACAMPDGCVAMGGKQGTLEYLRSNFNRHFSTNKAPLGIFLHASWFKRKPGNFDALMFFLEELSSMDDVWLLSVSQVVDWMRNPTPLSEISNMKSWKC